MLLVLDLALFQNGNVGLGGFSKERWELGQSRLAAVQPQKFSTIHTLLPAVGAGIATYFPFREGMAQLGVMLFTCQTSCALPTKSTYSKLKRFWPQRRYLGAAGIGEIPQPISLRAVPTDNWTHVSGSSRAQP